MIDRTVKYFADICNTEGPSSYKQEADNTLEIDRLLHQEQYIAPKLRVSKASKEAYKAVKAELGIKRLHKDKGVFR